MEVWLWNRYGDWAKGQTLSVEVLVASEALCASQGSLGNRFFLRYWILRWDRGTVWVLNMSIHRATSWGCRRSCAQRSFSWRTRWPRYARSTRCCASSLSRIWRPTSRRVCGEDRAEVGPYLGVLGPGVGPLLIQMQEAKAFFFHRAWASYAKQGLHCLAPRHSEGHASWDG